MPRNIQSNEQESRTSPEAPLFGTIALMASGGIEAVKAFDDYKSLCEVEQEIDVLKTDPDSLTSYMQANDRLEGRMFINFIALHIFYMIRRRLSDSGLDRKMSIREAIRILCRRRIVRLNDEWRIAKASSKDKSRLKALGVSIT